MIPELNKNEFLKIKRALGNAQELYDQGNYKSARLELRPALTMLERTPSKTRLEAACRILQGDILSALDDRPAAMHNYTIALDIFKCIQETSSLAEQTQKKAEKLLSV